MLILPGEDCQSKSDSRFSRCLDRRFWTIRTKENFESGSLGETKWGQKRALETGCLDRAPSMFCNWKGGGGGALAKESINYPTCLYATYVFNTIISTTIIIMGMAITYRTTGIYPHEQNRRAGPARTMHGQKGLSLLLLSFQQFKQHSLCIGGWVVSEMPYVVLYGDQCARTHCRDSAVHV